MLNLLAHTTYELLELKECMENRKQHFVFHEQTRPMVQQCNAIQYQAPSMHLDFSANRVSLFSMTPFCVPQTPPSTGFPACLAASCLPLYLECFHSCQPVMNSSSGLDMIKTCINHAIVTLVVLLDILDTARMAWPHLRHRLWARYLLCYHYVTMMRWAQPCDLRLSVLMTLAPAPPASLSSSQGWPRAWAAVSRCDGALTSRLEIRPLPSSEMSSNSDTSKS